ncbi:MAG TPA: amidohydrolase family protein, partial [Gaiella sp.]
MNIEELVAIDIHTHAKIPLHGDEDPLTKKQRLEASAMFKTDVDTAVTVDDVVTHYRERKMAAVVFGVDSEAGTGEVPVSNEEIAEVAAANPDVLIPFASIDPWKGKAGAREARRLISDHGIKGFKFHPSMQAFFPNDRHAYVLYEAIAEAGLPALFHTGQSGIGMGQPGGGGIRLKYSNPIFLDDVAVDFPEMPIILAHPSMPWQDEAIAVAMHKPQVYI